MSRIDWSDDPEIQRQLRERSVRTGIVRTAIIWTPLFLLSGGALAWFALDMMRGGEQGTWFLLVVLGLFTTLFGFQSVQALLDLRGRPGQLEDVVTRRWSRSDSLVMRSHYIRLSGRTILRGDALTLDGIKEGDRVRVRYYPHSAVLVSAEKLVEPQNVAEEALREEDSNL